MSEHEVDLETLRRAFAAAGGAPPRDGADCPQPERIWAAARGALHGAERDALLDHVASCSACAEDWRLALELMRGERGGATVLPMRRPLARRWAPLVPAVAAAALLVVVGVDMKERRDERVVVAMRGDEQGAIQSLIDEPLPRDRALLRWSGPPGAVYDVSVRTEDLGTELARARGLTAPEYLIPRDKLATVPAGAKIVWQIEAALPEGERQSSPTFVTELR